MKGPKLKNIMGSHGFILINFVLKRYNKFSASSSILGALKSKNIHMPWISFCSYKWLPNILMLVGSINLLTFHGMQGCLAQWMEEFIRFWIFENLEINRISASKVILFLFKIFRYPGWSTMEKIFMGLEWVFVPIDDCLIFWF